MKKNLSKSFQFDNNDFKLTKENIHKIKYITIINILCILLQQKTKLR